MGRQTIKVNIKRYIFFIAMTIVVAMGFYAYAQYKKSELKAPANYEIPKEKAKGDSIKLPYKVAPTSPATYEQLSNKGEHPVDLKTPKNIKTEIEFDIASGYYIVHTKVGDSDICPPFMLTPNEYHDITLRESLIAYYQQKNKEEQATQGKKKFNFLDMQFGLGPLEKIFGPGGVQLKTQGSVALNLGIKSNKTDNPALNSSARRNTYFDFQQKIQATINASVGDKLKFNMTYNTDATFDFDSKNLKLAYEGKEDEIIKSIEAGNVSMTTGSSLIKGGSALFGVKAKLQFGKLTATALVSQQNSQTQTVNTKGGVQTTSFSVACDKYDSNRHFFLGHFFRDNYDTWTANLPIVTSGVSIKRVEVWVTNKKSSYSNARNVVGFLDLAETDSIYNKHWIVDMTQPKNPSNQTNSLLPEIKTLDGARDISQVTNVLDSNLSGYGITGGTDYEKVESARLLSSTEYTLNSTLGYISLKTALNADEVLCVAYEYTYKGNTYQVGEFSGDITNTSQCLFVKMLKSSTISPHVPIWHLMMKNVYSIGGSSIQSTNFKLQIKYQSDTTGTEINYLPTDNLRSQTLLQVMNLDRLDSNKNVNSDGSFDFLEGYTINASTGRIIFPVKEPFGRWLEKKIGNQTEAQKYVFKELYDSTLVQAQKHQDKNKFVLTGEYQASNSSQIRLNAMNVAKGSVVVTAGGVTLTENTDYTVDYNMGIVNIINQSIIDAGTNIQVTLENQSAYSTQRKTLLGVDLNYQFSKDFNVGATFMHYSVKNLTEKVSLGNEAVNNSIWGINFSFKKSFMWLTNWLNKIPTVNATQPSKISLTGEFAQLIPHKQKTGSTTGSSYIDDFESTQSGIDLRNPYGWFLCSTPSNFKDQATLSNDVRYGYGRARLAWYYIDRLFTQRNSNSAPSYIRTDDEAQSNHYVREIDSYEIYPNKDLSYGESSTITTLDLSYYPEERGPYNLDCENIDWNTGKLLYPQNRWGGIMRKMDNTSFETSNIQYIQFWLLDPFLDENADNKEGGDLYFQLGDISEDILKDGYKFYENGMPINGDKSTLKKTNWGYVNTQSSVSYAFDNTDGARELQDVGLDGLTNAEEFEHESYKNYVETLKQKLNPTVLTSWQADKLSPINDPAGDNYHYYRGNDYDEEQRSILERYKYYNGVEGNSLAKSDDALYQSSTSNPDVEDINQDNTLNEYERYFEYKVSIRPEDLKVGSANNPYLTDAQASKVKLRNGQTADVTWYKFKIPLDASDRVVTGSINDMSTIRFMRMFLTNFKKETHLRFGALQLQRGEWRTYDYKLSGTGDIPADGKIEISAVNIEENGASEPVNYVLPPGVTRIVDSGSSQATKLNEQSLSVKVTGLKSGDSRAVYKNTSLDLRLYKRLQMFTHLEALINEENSLKKGDLRMFIRLGSDIKKNYYEYEVPLTVTPKGNYNNDLPSDQYIVWPSENMLDCATEVFTNLKTSRNARKRSGESGITFNTLYSESDPDHPANKVSVLGNPSLSSVKVIAIGVRNSDNIEHNGTMWVDELKVTEFDDKGGWAAKGNINLAVSDIATLNFGVERQTIGFGSVDKALTDRNTEQYDKINFAVQVDVGRFLPEKAKLKAPIYYSFSKETNTPEYNPLDQDIKLKDALSACETKAQRDSIMDFAQTRKVVESFSVSNLKFDVQSKVPKPWDPANFTFSYSSNKQRNSDATNDHENTSDYRGSFAYSYSPYIKPFTPFGKIKSKSANAKFLKEWQFRYVPNSIIFSTNMSRYYYEQQTRKDMDSQMSLPLSVNKNFIWDRHFTLTWNFTNSISASFSSNTTAHIEEPTGAVNRKLFPDAYKEWRDSIWRSIKNLGTPWAYNQTFTASYKAPFSRIPVLNFLSANATYNAVYKWDRGATIGDIEEGNTINSQSSVNVDARFNFETLFNKSKYLSDINKMFSGKSNNSSKYSKGKLVNKPKKFERTIQLSADTSIILEHNLKTKKVRISATTLDGKPFTIKTKVKDDNRVEVLTRGDKTLKFLVREEKKEEKQNSFWNEAAKYTLRFLMMPRNFSFRWKRTQTLTLPQFSPQIGDIFGQSTHYDALAPGLGFAFGFEDESYISKAKERGWLMCDENQTTPAISSRTKEFSFEFTLEPISGLKITLTSNLTDNRTSQYQFMYENCPTTYSGSYTRTHWAIGTAFEKVSASDSYNSATFNKFIDYIDIMADRYNNKYIGTSYPESGFIKGTTEAGQPFSKETGVASSTSSDVLIPAFLAAYSKRDPNKINMNPFPGLGEMRPNWKVTYDGLSRIPWIKEKFKSVTLTHAYQCTYSVGSYSSFTNYVSIGDDMGFTRNELTQKPIPSSPYNITSVSITEKFAPLIGLSVTMKNNLTFSAEYRNSRTLTLNSSSGQIVEALQSGLVIGAGYKIANFNTVLKMKGSGQGISHDLTMNLNFQLTNNRSLIRRFMETSTTTAERTNSTQATSGTRTLTLNITAKYILSKLITVGAYFDQSVNTPLVSTTAYPTSNTSAGISINLSLTR